LDHTNFLPEEISRLKICSNSGNSINLTCNPFLNPSSLPLQLLIVDPNQFFIGTPRLLPGFFPDKLIINENMFIFGENIRVYKNKPFCSAPKPPFC
jgi:hypothetical protein